MPVVGLPATVEVALDSLLAEKTVTSWKIAGLGDTTVVVLRLRDDNTCQHGGGEGEARLHNNNVYYRRKTPSQLRRDQQRAKQRTYQKTEKSHQASELNPTVSSCVPSSADVELFVDIENRPTDRNDNTPTPVSPASTCSTLDTTHDAACLSHSIAMCAPQSQQQQVGLASSDPTTTPPASVFGAQTVKEYVGAIFYKPTLQKLRDKQRNTRVVKAFQFQRDGQDFVACQSDDIVIIMDPALCYMAYWFILQPRRFMQMEEKVWLSKLSSGREPVDRGKRLLVTQTDQDLLPTLVKLIQYFLG
jgi:hypothetical protein